MFGYINPDRPYLFLKDDTLYRAIYCGVCKGIGKECGQIARTSLTYDMAFMSALFHNIMQKDFTVKKRRCIAHWIRRRPMADVDDITLILGALNCTLAYYKLVDDRLDKDAKGLFSYIYKRGYKKAVKKHPAAKEIIEKNTAKVRELEKRGCSVIDEICEPNAKLIEELSEYVLGSYATKATSRLCYAIGKWIYLADALDDYDKDVKKGRYNALFAAFGCETKKEAIEKNGAEIKFIFDALFSDMREALADIKFNYNHDLTDNIILRGIPAKSRRLFYGPDEEK